MSANNRLVNLAIKEFNEAEAKLCTAVICFGQSGYLSLSEEVRSLVLELRSLKGFIDLINEDHVKS